MGPGKRCKQCDGGAAEQLGISLGGGESCLLPRDSWDTFHLERYPGILCISCRRHRNPIHSLRGTGLRPNSIRAPHCHHSTEDETYTIQPRGEIVLRLRLLRGMEMGMLAVLEWHVLSPLSGRDSRAMVKRGSNHGVTDLASTFLFFSTSFFLSC